MSRPRQAHSVRPVSSKIEPSHLPLHRRLLFPTYPPERALPPLVTGDGDEIDQLNEKLYNLIALAFRAYILSWLPRITRDKSLLPHVHSQFIVPILQPIFLHLSTRPESLITLIIYDLPSVLTLHWKTYWQARQTIHILPNSLDGAYHAHLPLVATIPSPDTMSEEGRTTILKGQYIVSGLWLTSLADTIAKKSLSEEDYKVTVQRTMIREIIGRTVLGNLSRRINEPAFWWSLFLRFLPLPRSTKKRAHQNVVERVVTMIQSVMRMVWRVWTIGTDILVTLSSVPDAKYDQVTDCWIEFMREALNVDGRLGRQNWALRIVWGIVEGLCWLFSPITDRLIPHLLTLYLLQPKTAIWLVDLIEKILFPLDGYPAPTPPDPSAEEIAAMRRLVEERLSHSLSAHIRTVIAPTTTDLQSFLDPLSDAGCNAHLMGLLYNTICGTLVPELVVSKPEEMLKNKPSTL